MLESVNIVEGRYGGANLCERCAAGTRIDDSEEEFYVCNARTSEPTVRHQREVDKRVRLSPTIQWDDESPKYPTLNTSAAAGCKLCAFILKHLIRRDIKHHGSVTISCCYIWAGRKEIYICPSLGDEGLSHMRCEVFDSEEQIAKIIFPITAAEDVRSWLRTADQIYQDPMCPENIDWIRAELSSCDTECGHPTPPTTFVPTRLIDIGEGENSKPRLVATASLTGDTKYATLSYCWGPMDDADQQLKTTRSTLYSFYQEIPEDQLTPVIRDTLQVCRALRIRYVWIDALCIIQGCKDDWPRESEVMGLVYYHSYLTICPLSSHSCLQSFLLPRPGVVNFDFQSKIDNRIRGSLILHSGYHDAEKKPLSTRWHDVHASTWSKRGWTLQEESLSPRLLLFGESMIHFVCENAEISENGHMTGGPGVISGLRELKSLSSNRSRGSKHRACATWCQHLWSIHKRSFTYPPDLLPSIAGLARACAEILDDSYMAGLWKRYIHFGLLWVLKGPPPGSLEARLEALRYPDHYIAPSWSWASHKEYFESYIPLWGPNSRPSHVHSRITVIDYDVVLESEANPYGRIKSAALILRGKLTSLPSDIQMRPDEEKYAMGHFADKLGTVMFDWVVTKRAVQKRNGMVMLLTTSCCQATTNETSQFFANPDEDHTATFSATQPKVNQCDDEDKEEEDDDDDEEEEEEEEGEEDDEDEDEDDEDDEDNDDEEYDEDDDDGIVSATTCLSCHDEINIHNCWGLMLHPAETSGAYVRVGVFQLFGGSGGLNFFRDVAERDVVIV